MYDAKHPLCSGLDGIVIEGSSGQLVFETSIPFTGDITFDASNSSFVIAEIQALTALGTSLGHDSDGDGIVTLSQAVAGEYKFVMVGEATGVYHVKIQCVSDSPTNDPTTPPVNHPITAPIAATTNSNEPTAQLSASLSTERTLPNASRPDTTFNVNSTTKSPSMLDPNVILITICFVVIAILCCSCCATFLCCRYLKKEKREKPEHEMINIQMGTTHETHIVPQDVDFEGEIVASWLRNTVRLPQYIDLFLSHGFDSMEFIQAIGGHDDLRELGIKMTGHRTRILGEIKVVRELRNLL